MNKSRILQDIKGIIEEQNKISINDENQSLAVDSFTIILLLTYAQEEMDLELDTEKLDFENFESLASIEDVFFSGGYLVCDPSLETSSGG